MKKLTAFGGVALAAIALTLSPQKAEAYPIDCAILICLSGGFPPSTPCVRAKAEFIRRITPFPIEPPLQIWRCPMGVSYSGPQGNSTAFERLYDASTATASIPPYSQSPMGNYPEIEPVPAIVTTANNQDAGAAVMLWLAQQADIDISDPAFDFVRSIKVW